MEVELFESVEMNENLCSQIEINKIIQDNMLVFK